MHKRAKKMAPSKQVHFRLRQSTIDMLRAILADSGHRSMASLADEILGRELARMLRERETDGES
jgi:hypothetical protein